MKKILSMLLLCSFVFINFSVKTYADLDSYFLKNKTYYETQLLNNAWGVKFINLIKKFVETNKNNIEKLKEISTKLENIDISKVKKADTISKVMYAIAIINLSINESNETVIKPVNYEKLSLTIYEDKRCTDCPTEEVITQLKQLPSTAWINIIRKDFSDVWVSDYLIKNQVKVLPLIVFSTNNFDVTKDPAQTGSDGQIIPKVNEYLSQLPEWEYFLNIWASFNPFEKRSERWYKLLDKSILDNIKKDSYIKWNKDAKITWLEYSDLECPFCAKLHNSTTTDDLNKKYGNNLNIIFNHFPLEFHDNAQPWAEILECLWEQKWTDAFYSLIDKSYTDQTSTKEYLIKESLVLWANETILNKCITDWKYTKKVKDQLTVWSTNFSVVGTPSSIIINNSTLEYEIIWWAYPTSTFEEIIDKLLK